MPIIYNNSNDTSKPTYEGCVLSTRIERDRRIMSDVWADCYYATVWTGTEVVEIGLGASGHCCDSASEDATDEVKVLVAAWREAEAEKAHIEWEAKAPEREAARLKAEAAEEKRKVKAAKAYINTPTKGSRVVVARRRGRNAPPLGTEGTVFWTGTSNFGTERIGMKDDADETYWTTAGNVDVVLPDVPSGTEPSVGWVAYSETLRATRKSAEEAARKAKEAKTAAEFALLPSKNTWVRRLDDSNAFGKVFWRGITKKGVARIGFKLLKKDRDAFWAGVGEFEVLTGDPRKGGVGVLTPSLDSTPAPSHSTHGTVNATNAGKDSVPEDQLAASWLTPPLIPTLLSLPDDETPKVNPLGHLPDPFNTICVVNGCRAFAADGTFIVEVPSAVAAEWSALLAG
jgi:hypothetical protein